jgi:hypothetical protein
MSLKDITTIKNPNRTELIDIIKLYLSSIENTSIDPINKVKESIIEDLTYIASCKKSDGNIINYRNKYYIRIETKLKHEIQVLIDLIHENIKATHPADILWAQLAQIKINKLFEIMNIYNWNCTQTTDIIRDSRTDRLVRGTEPAADVTNIFSFTEKYGGGTKQKYKRRGTGKLRTRKLRKRKTRRNIIMKKK